MQLCIDIGNTCTAFAVFKEREPIHSGIISENDDWNELITRYTLSAVAVSNVSTKDRIPVQILALDPTIVNCDTPLPISIEYETPSTLGSDRICAAVGGHTLHPDSPVLTIDLGTCIKYELVTADGTYHGGNIGPGMSMRFRSLNEGTANLPLVKSGVLNRDMGQSTNEAIHNGVMLGMICEMDAMIDRIRALHPELVTVMTGGDVPHFENALKTPIFAHPLLVLQGLNEIILFNQSIDP